MLVVYTILLVYTNYAVSVHELVIAYVKRHCCMEC